MHLIYKVAWNYKIDKNYIINEMLWLDFMDHLNYINVFEAEQDYRNLLISENHLLINSKSKLEHRKLGLSFIKVINTVRRVKTKPDIQNKFNALLSRLKR